MKTVSKRWTALAVLLVIGALAVPAAAPADAGYLEKLPPLVDRKLFFDDPKYAGAQISPEGRHISFLSAYKGVRNIWVKGTDEAFEDARPITADTERPVSGYFWSEDGRYVLYVQDKGGNENFHIYAVDPTAPAEEATGVPPARDLTPLEGVRAFIYAVPEATPNEILIGLNDRDPALHDVYRLNLETGERQKLIQNDANVAAWIPDLSGAVRLAFRQTDDGGSEILRVEDGQLGDAIYSCTFEESCGPARFHKDGKHLYLVSNKGDADLTRLLLLDVMTGETTLVESDPEGEVDFGGPIFSEKTEELIGTFYRGDRVRIYPRDEAFAKSLEFLRSHLPDGELGVSSITNDDRFYVVSVSRDLNPGEVYLYDQEARRVEKLYDSRPELPSESLATMKAIRYKARDGQEIPAYLTVPRNVEAKNLPLLVSPHGGPWARDSWGYDPWAQFLANRGYAVLQMNFRGSTGYGKAFLNAGNKEWGTGIMQHDITDGVKYLVEQGIADPKKVAILGGSYGGYATLAGVTFTPDLYAAGVSIVGPSNIITLLNSIPPYWGPVKKIFTRRVGDADDPEDRARLEAQSPFFHAKQIKAPLLIVQGANDPRVKKAESDQIVVALRDLGRPVEYVVAGDEGHGFRGRENRLAMMARIESFLAKHLGGRYQESMAPEVAEKLAAITVDVASVEMPKMASGADAAKTAPLPVVSAQALAAVKLAYTSHLAMGGQEMTVESRREVSFGEADGQKVVHVDASMSSPMGSGSDAFVLQARNLRPISREASQGPAKISVAYADDAVTGKIQAGPQEIPIDVKLEAPAFGDSGAFDTVITALPLAEGYRTTLRNVEVGMQQRVRVWALEVLGAETVEVPAGSFATFKVNVSALDGEGGDRTIWITREAPRFLVRAEGKLPPQMGGGDLTTELTSRE